MTVDELLSLLVVEFREEMVQVHRTVVSRFPGATDASTLGALQRAGAPRWPNSSSGLSTSDSSGGGAPARRRPSAADAVVVGPHRRRGTQLCAR